MTFHPYVKLLLHAMDFNFLFFFEKEDRKILPIAMILSREKKKERKKEEEEKEEGKEIVSAGRGGIKFTRSRLSVRLNTKKMYSARQHFSIPLPVNPVCRHTMDPMNSTAFQFRS